MALLNGRPLMDPVVEVVRLKKEAMSDGVYRWEFAFMSDGTVFTRITSQDGENQGWSLAPQTWKCPEDLDLLSENHKAKGWTAVWHPAYGPAIREFTQFVPAEDLLLRKDQFCNL